MATAPGPQTSQPRANACILLLLANLGWGSNAVASKIAVGQISPIMITTGRWGVVLLVLCLTCRRKVAEGLPQLRVQWRIVLVMGAFGFTAYSALSYLAAHFTSALHLSILFGTTPLLVLFGSFIVHPRPLRMIQIGGAAFGLAGVALVASNGHLENLGRQQLNLGDLMILGGCVLYAGYTIALRSRGAVADIGPVGLLFGLAMAAFLTSLPLLTIEVARDGFQAPTAKGWMLLVYIGLVPSLLCHLWFIRAVALIGPARSGMFLNLLPVFGALLAVLVLHEQFGSYKAAALIFVLGGVFLSEWGAKERDTLPSRAQASEEGPEGTLLGGGGGRSPN